MTRSHVYLFVGRILRSLWFTPALYAFLAFATLIVAPYIAHFIPQSLVGLIGVNGVYDLLDALASTLLAVAIFSLGIMVSSLHAVSSAATPRVRPLLVEDSTARRAISTFIGGFVYGVVGIVVLSTGYYSDVAKLLLFAVTCVVILILIFTLIRWIARLSRLGDVNEAIDLVERAARAALEDIARSQNLGGHHSEGAPANGIPVGPVKLGFVQAIDVGDLSSIADDLDIDIHVVARPGDFVGPGHPLLVVPRLLSKEDIHRLQGTFIVGEQRTFELDPRFALTVLSEIGSRALSPGINDAGTAIDVLATSTRILVDWSDKLAGADDEVCHPRLYVKPLNTGDLLGDAFRWIARDGASQLEVQIWVQKGLGMLIAKDEPLFGDCARALSREAMARAEAGLTLPEDRERLRDMVERLKQG